MKKQDIQGRKITLVYGLLCDELIRDEQSKKASAIGIFDRIYTETVPAAHRRLVIFTRWEGNPGEYHLTLFLRRPGGSKDTLEIPNLIIESNSKDVQFAINVVNLQINQFGEHVFEIVIDEEVKEEIKFDVRKPTQG